MRFLMEIEKHINTSTATEKDLEGLSLKGHKVDWTLIYVPLLGMDQMS